MFANFPKIRPALPKEIKAIYSAHYKSNWQGLTTASSLSQRMESWMHRQAANDLTAPKDSKKVTLEIGAGTLNHLQYESMVETYDIAEPFADLYKNSVNLPRIRNIYSNIFQVPVDARYDRIVSIAALEHICDLPNVIAKSGLLLAKNGAFRASIPNEGAALWKLGWKLTTGLEFKLKYGLDYGLLMKHEHVNTAKEIEEVLKYFFKKIKCKVFGLTKSISLYRYYECGSPRLERCNKFFPTSVSEEEFHN
ncbi:MAG: class I SAM-dependent methyltransferase [Deltaproteobacteria bacterium]|nr:class I SAM-dependent methyltransferase [Deltaproteobacteria bacterium]